jgi:hypothetical protein
VLTWMRDLLLGLLGGSVLASGLVAVRSAIIQAIDSGVPIFIKQQGGDVREWPLDLHIQQFPIQQFPKGE